MLVCSLTLTTPRGPQSTGAAPLWLEPGEHLRWQSFASHERREQFLAGRWQLRSLLAELTGGRPGQQIADIDEQGRTWLKQGLHASISHSGPWLIVGVAERPLGVDLERLRPRRDVLGMARLVHSRLQCEQLYELDETSRLLQFYRWWTLKEAWLKRNGQGLDFKRMRELEFEPADPSQAQALSVVDATRGLVLAFDTEAGTATKPPDGFGGAQHLRPVSVAA